MGSIELKGVDYTRRIDPAKLKAAGIQFVIRYLKNGTQQWSSGKGIGKAELDELVANGIRVGFVFETDTHQMEHGFNAGVAHAKSAAVALVNLGVPRNWPIAYGHDEDGALGVGQYLEGVATVTSLDSGGIYGGKLAINTAVAEWANHHPGHRLLKWPTLAWFGTKAIAGADWYQGGAHAWSGFYWFYHVTIGGVGCDKDTAFTDYGLWPPGQQEEPWMASQADFDKFHAASHGSAVTSLKKITSAALGLYRRGTKMARPTGTSAVEKDKAKLFDYVESLENPPQPPPGP